MSKASENTDMETDYDVVIIGGGIHGVGCAQAAAASGYRTLLVEQHDIASATSSRSSKLIHGGLRYLESSQFSLVAESLRERELLLRNAPDLVRLVPFTIPVYRHTRRKSWQIAIGLSLYALLGRFRPSTRFRRLPKQQWSDLTGLKTDDLKAVYQYADGQTDDAELARAVMQSAQALGAELMCPARFINATYDNGFTISLVANNMKHKLTTHALINATGPWINTVLANTQPRPDTLAIELVQGSHIVLNEPAPETVFYVEAEDGRAVFIMPWQGKTLVGTTEKAYDGDPATVAATDEEIDYLVRTAKRIFPNINSTIIDSFAGLRVLPHLPVAAFHRSRETLLHSNKQLPGMISIVGGKLTAYRSTAEKVLKLLAAHLPEKKQIADTRLLRLSKAE